MIDCEMSIVYQHIKVSKIIRNFMFQTETAIERQKLLITVQLNVRPMKNDNYTMHFKIFFFLSPLVF